jgi:uncharacterized phage protein gp47/JayE
MSGPYPLATLAAVVTATGISAPSYDDIFLSLCASYRLIYGADVDLDPDTQDGQWIGIIAQAVNDTNAAAIAAYNGMSPSTAVGVGLSSVVKINGLKREVATNSTVNVEITGTAGTQITDGSCADNLGNVWMLPALVTIPPSSTITVTATAQNAGAVAAAANSITKINTPTRGWLTVTNPSIATLGAPVETDGILHVRQSNSTAIAAVTPIQTIQAAVENISGVTRVSAHDNDTNSADVNGIPAHNICLIIEGGDATTIAQTIANTKAPGVPTYGTTSELVLDSYGVPSKINFYTPTYERIVLNVTIKALLGYTATAGMNITAALIAYVNALPIGQTIYYTQLIAAAIEGSGAASTFNLTALTLAIYPATPVAADCAITFIQASTLASSDLTLTVS